MQQNNTVSIGALGLSDSEEKILKCIGALTRGRPQGGCLVNREPEINDSNIVIVNVDDIGATTKWRTLAAKSRPPVMVQYSKEPPTDPSQHYLLRPIRPTKLMALLDSLFAELSKSAQN